MKDAIRTEIEATVPRHRPRDNVLVYTNRKIRSLYKDKSSLASSLNRLLDHRNQYYDSPCKIAELNRQTEAESVKKKSLFVDLMYSGSTIIYHLTYALNPWTDSHDFIE